MYFIMTALAIAFGGSEYPYGFRCRLVLLVAIVTLSSGVFSGNLKFRFVVVELVIHPLLDIMAVLAIVVAHKFRGDLTSMDIGMASDARDRGFPERPLLIGVVTSLAWLSEM